MSRFRPQLEEIEGRLTPAINAASVSMADFVVNYDAGLIRFAEENWLLLIGPSTQAQSQQGLNAIVAMNTWAVGVLNEFSADLIAIVQADPATVPVVGPAFAQAQTDVALANQTTGMAQAFSNYITANPALTPARLAAAAAAARAGNTSTGTTTTGGGPGGTLNGTPTGTTTGGGVNLGTGTGTGGTTTGGVGTGTGTGTGTTGGTTGTTTGSATGVGTTGVTGGTPGSTLTATPGANGTPIGTTTPA